MLRWREFCDTQPAFVPSSGSSLGMPRLGYFPEGIMDLLCLLDIQGQISLGNNPHTATMFIYHDDASDLILLHELLTVLDVVLWTTGKEMRTHTI